MSADCCVADGVRGKATRRRATRSRHMGKKCRLCEHSQIAEAQLSVKEKQAECGMASMRTNLVVRDLRHVTGGAAEDARLRKGRELLARIPFLNN